MAKKTAVKKADAVKVEVKEAPKAEVKAEVKEAPKAEVKTEVKEAPKAEAKAAAKEAPKAEAKKAETPAKKAPCKKAAAKKTAAKTAVYVQYAGSEKSVDEIVEAAKAAATAEVKDITVYVKPEDNAAYYVINGGEEMGKIIL